MIKINLATRKQAGYVGSGKGAFGLSGAGFDFELLKELPIKKLGLLIIVFVACSVMSSIYQESEIEKITTEITALKNEDAELTRQLAKRKGYEREKTQLEEDEKTFRTKIQTIESLISSRDHLQKTLIAVAESIPREVWLSGLKYDAKGVSFSGVAVDYDHISDFMRNLGESVYYHDLELKDTKKTKIDRFDATDFSIFGEWKNQIEN